MHKTIYIIQTFIIVFYILFSEISFDVTSSNEFGNTCGNIKQMGYAVEKDSWIYYNDPTGNGKYELRNCLFKKRADGSQKHKDTRGRFYCAVAVEWL